MAAALALNPAVSLALLDGLAHMAGLRPAALGLAAGALCAAGFALLSLAIWPRVLPFRSLPRPGPTPASPPEERTP